MIHRVLLLSLAAGLFALVWAKDRPFADRTDLESTAAARLMRRESDLAAGWQRRWVARPVAVTPCEMTSSAAVLPGGRIPSPRGLSAGLYQVVGSRGETCRVLLPQSAACGTSPPAGAGDVYVVSCGTSRWHFIRLDETYAANVALTGPGRVAPAEVIQALTVGAQALVRLRELVAARVSAVMERAAASARKTMVSARSRIVEWQHVAAGWGEWMGESLEATLRRIGRSRRVSAAGEMQRR